MAGWLLWMLQHPSPLWKSYLAMLPTETEMCCLLNFSKAEIEELQVPQLQASSAHDCSWLDVARLTISSLNYHACQADTCPSSA